MNITDHIRNFRIRDFFAVRFGNRGARQKPGKSLKSHKTGSDGENPYLTARRSWNEHVGSIVSSRQTWQLIGILSLLLSLASIGGMIYIGSRSRFIPYVIEVDKLGQIAAAGPVMPASTTDPRVTGSIVSTFIFKARTVTPDVALERKFIYDTYAHLAPNDPGTEKMNEYLTGQDKFQRAATTMVSVTIHSVLRQSPHTWQVEWVETTRDRQGALKGIPVNMRALVTVYTTRTTARTPAAQMLKNPLGIFIRDFSWSPIL